VSVLHPDVKAALAAEIAGDPAGRGYAGKSASERAALMSEGYAIAPAQTYRNVLISDVKGYLAARLVIVRLRRGLTDMPEGQARDIAEALLDILHDTQLREFLTADEELRNNVLGMFAVLAQAGAGGLTLQHYADIVAMTVAPAEAPVRHHSRWLDLMLALKPEAAAGLPNEVDAGMIAEALA